MLSANHHRLIDGLLPEWRSQRERARGSTDRIVQQPDLWEEGNDFDYVALPEVPLTRQEEDRIHSEYLLQAVYRRLGRHWNQYHIDRENNQGPVFLNTTWAFQN